MNIDELTNMFSDFQTFGRELQCKATSAYDVMSWHHLMSCMDVARRSGRVSGSHARDPGLFLDWPPQGQPKPFIPLIFE